ncbi:MAG TPA: hypothetical protein PKL54_03895 [Candidatus Hydrogenedentes bacterium]|nr:hypothetical protein [Candidatus Hydrogenedentota bacterium]
MSGGYMMVALVCGAVGTGMLVYGVRQKEPLVLAFGVAFGVLPMVLTGSWGSLIGALVLGAAFYGARKRFM